MCIPCPCFWAAAVKGNMPSAGRLAPASELPSEGRAARRPLVARVCSVPSAVAGTTLITWLVAEAAFLHQHAPLKLHLCASRPLIVKMWVDKGDTLESLSKACGLPVETLVAANGGAPCGCVCQHRARRESSLRACPLTLLRR